MFGRPSILCFEQGSSGVVEKSPPPLENCNGSPLSRISSEGEVVCCGLLVSRCTKGNKHENAPIVGGFHAQSASVIIYNNKKRKCTFLEDRHNGLSSPLSVLPICILQGCVVTIH